MKIGHDGLPVRQHNWTADARRGVPLDAAAIDAEMDEIAEMVRTLWARHNELEKVIMRGGAGAGAPSVIHSAPSPAAISQAVAAAVAPLRNEFASRIEAVSRSIPAAAPQTVTQNAPDPGMVARVAILEDASRTLFTALPDQTTINRITALEAALVAMPRAVAAAPATAAAVNLTPITDRLTALERGLAAAAEASLTIARDVIVRQRLLLEARAALDDGDPDGSNYPLLEAYAAGRRIHDAAEHLFAAQAEWSALAAGTADPGVVVTAWRAAV